jgi:hypothetical protein
MVDGRSGDIAANPTASVKSAITTWQRTFSSVGIVAYCRVIGAFATD